MFSIYQSDLLNFSPRFFLVFGIIRLFPKFIKLNDNKDALQ